MCKFELRLKKMSAKETANVFGSMRLWHNE